MSTRTNIAIVIFGMVNAVIFGIGAVTVLSIPALADRAMILLPIVVAASFLISPFVAWFMAPRLRLRHRHALKS
jgi:hypothetical protein